MAAATVQSSPWPHGEAGQEDYRSSRSARRHQPFWKEISDLKRGDDPLEKATTTKIHANKGVLNKGTWLCQTHLTSSAKPIDEIKPSDAKKVKKGQKKKGQKRSKKVKKVKNA